MSFGHLLQSVFELGLVCVTIWAAFHREQINRWEDAFFAAWRRKKFKVIRVDQVNTVRSTYTPFVDR